MAVEETVSDPHVRPRGRVAQLPLANPTLRRNRGKQGMEGWEGWGGRGRCCGEL